MREAESMPAVSPKLSRGLWSMAGVGFGALIVGLVLSPQQAGAGLLLASLYLLGLGLGGLVFIALHYVTKAGWSTALRRIPEALGATLPIAAGAMAVSLLVGLRWLYPWTGHDTHTDASLAVWWQPTFFYARSLLYLLAWIAFSVVLIRISRRQDRTADVRDTNRSLGVSAAFLVVFGLTLSLASFDWLMSLQPHWYSTIFAIYNFAGMVLSALAVITLVMVVLRRLGPLRGIITEAHRHDLGKYIFAISTFWAYIWFSQYMLIWYANISEEVSYYVTRATGGWMGASLLVLVVNWVIPFFVLLPASAKRDENILVKICILLLIGRWLDLYVMVVPRFQESPLSVNLVWQIGVFGGLLSLFVLAFLRSLRQAPLLPAGDPMLAESLHHHA